MSKHVKTRKSTTLNRTAAVGAIAGCALGFGALSAALAPIASADSWWILSDNTTTIGSNGNGNSNQFGGIANGNIGNAQNNVPILSPVTASGIATNAALAAEIRSVLGPAEDAQ